MHLPTVVSQLAADRAKRRTDLLCQKEKYKQLLETDLFFKTSEFLMVAWTCQILGMPKFSGQCSEGKISS